MRYSYLLTLIFLLLVFPLLNCTGKTTSPDNEKITFIGPITEYENLEVLDPSPEIHKPEHLKLAISYEGTTELTGNNDGIEIEKFLSNVGLSKGNPYCAAFISYILDETPNIKEPTIRTALASKFITKKSISANDVLLGKEIPPGSIMIFQKGNTIFGHAALVESQESNSEFSTIEANTKPGPYGNQRDGDGIWFREREIQPANYFRITEFTLVAYNPLE